MKKLVLVLSLIALVPFALAACGGDDNGDDGDEPAPADQAEQPADGGQDGGGGGGAATMVPVTADPGGELAYEEASLEAEAGEVTFDLTNESSTPHDVTIEDPEGNDVGATDVITGDTDSVTVDLAAGEYTFYCSVSGHREAGMEGPLTVD